MAPQRMSFNVFRTRHHYGIGLSVNTIKFANDETICFCESLALILYPQMTHSICARVHYPNEPISM